MPQVPEGSPFQDFFDEFFKGQGGEGGNRQRTVNSLGSGFVIDPAGFIVTNNHVIEGADDIEVNFANGTKLKAKLIGTDTKTDLAVLKVEPKKPLTAVPFGDSRTDAHRRLGDGDRQPVRARRHGDGRHHLGARPQHQCRPLRQFHPDGCRDQPAAIPAVRCST